MKNTHAPDNNTGEILNEERSGNEGYTHITTHDSVHHIVNHPWTLTQWWAQSTT